MRDDFTTETIDFLWNFYERAINNYSIIIRMLRFIGDEEGLFQAMPRIIVQEMPFDVCKIILAFNETKKEGFYSIDELIKDIDAEMVRTLNNGTLFPTTFYDVSGFSKLYVYPLKEEMRIIGFIVLGKKLEIFVNEHTLREIETICDIYNTTILLHERLHGSRREVSGESPYESLVGSFPEPMMMIDREGTICSANERARKEFAEECGLLIGAKIDSIIGGIDNEFFTDEGFIEGEVSYKGSEEYKMFKMECYPLKGGDAQGVWKGIILRNVLEKRVADEERLLKKKVESIGMLTGGIAHDFNNLLTGMLGYASMIKNLLPAEGDMYRYAEAIEHSAQRAAKLTKHLLNFSRRQRRASDFVDINMLIDDILFLVKESFREIEVEKQLDGRITLIRGDEAQLQNAILNILMNAKDAIGDRGTIRVTTEKIQHTDGKQYVLVGIEDSGGGIASEIRAKIFKPYFSTKEGDGSHLGMGLYIVDKTIKGHGGFIEVESEKIGKTRFKIYLPITGDVFKNLLTKKEKITAKKIRVLVVDDEDFIRDLVRGVLTNKVVEIFEAADGEEAVKIFKQKSNKIDLVILDMIMPGMKGDEVLRIIRDIKPVIKVIVSSGFMSEDQRERLKKYDIDAFLDKPFKNQDLEETIQSLFSN